MKELTSILEKMPNGCRNNYNKLEEAVDSEIVLSSNITSFMGKKFYEMKNPEINHEFGGYLYGIKKDEKYIILGISENYSNASKIKANVSVNSEHIKSMKKDGAGIIGRWHTHNVPGFSVADLKSAISNKWAYQNFFDLCIELVIGQEDGRAIPKMYSLSIEGRNNNYEFKKPKITALNINNFIKKYDKKPHFILGLP